MTLTVVLSKIIRDDHVSIMPSNLQTQKWTHSQQWRCVWGGEEWGWGGEGLDTIITWDLQMLGQQKLLWLTMAAHIYAVIHTELELSRTHTLCGLSIFTF